MFTQEQIKEIKEKLAMGGSTDSHLPLATLPLTGKETLALIQEGKNKRVAIDEFYEEFSQYIDKSERVDFFNVSRYAQRISGAEKSVKLTLEEAVNICPNDVRRGGQILLFLNKNNVWTEWRYLGTSADNWTDVSDTNYWIKSSLFNIELLDNRTIKPVSFTENNIPILDAEGNLKDSTKNVEDFATKEQGEKADSAVQELVINPIVITGEADTQAQIINTGSDPQHLNLQFIIPKGKDGKDFANPFKGWFTTNPPTTGAMGDYCYVTVNSLPYIFNWDETTHSFINSGEIADTTNMQSFATSQAVGNVSIDDSKITNDTGTSNSPTLVKVEDVMPLKAKLQDITFYEVKADVSNAVDGKVLPNNGLIDDSTISESIYYKSIELVIPTNATQIRFLAFSPKAKTGWALGYAFGKYENGEWVNLYSDRYSSNSYSNTAEDSRINIPEGASIVRLTCHVRYNNVTYLDYSKFYCYFQIGTNLVTSDLMSKINSSIFGNYTKVISTTNIITDSTIWSNSRIYYNFIETLGGNGKNINASSDNQIINEDYLAYLKENNYRLLITKNDDTPCWITFLKEIPEEGSATLEQLINDNVLCSIHYITSTLANPVITFNGTKEFEIPEDCNCIVLSKRNSSENTNINHKPNVIKLVRYDYTDAIPNKVNTATTIVSDLETKMSNINDDLYGEEESIETIDDFGTNVYFGLDARSGILYSISNYASYEIDVSSYNQVQITAADHYNCFFIITKQKLEKRRYYLPEILSLIDFDVDYTNTSRIDSPYRQAISAGSTETIKFTSNSKYLYIAKDVLTSSVEDRTPKHIVFTRIVRSGGFINSIVSASNGFCITPGALDSNGKIIKSNTSYVTSPILLEKGWFIRTNYDKGWYVNKVYLYDSKHTFLGSYTHFNLQRHYYADFSSYGSNICANGYYVIVELAHRSNYDWSDEVVKSFVYLNDNRLYRITPAQANLDWKEFQKRIKQFTYVNWKALAYIEGPSEGAIDDDFFKKDNTFFGIPYSETSQYNKYVGHDVSFKTFLTATLNKRSLLYTENIIGSASSSKYGIKYNGYDYSGSYIGSVCTGLTSYVAGLNVLMYTNIWSKRTTNMTVIAKENKSNGVFVKENDSWITPSDDMHELIDKLKPMQFILTPGHCSVISDVYRNSDGEVLFIVWTEETFPEARNIVYDVDAFLTRLNNLRRRHPEETITISGNDDDSGTTYWVLYDGSSLSYTNTSEDTKDYIANNWFNIATKLSIPKDISTFAGEYASFSTLPYTNDIDGNRGINNNKVILNVHRGNKYTHLQIFNELDNDHLDVIREYSITGTQDYISQSTLYDEDAISAEDWINFDLKKATLLPEGLYRARVVVKNGETIEEYSEDTHFELIDPSFTIGGTSVQDMYIDFGQKKPYLVRRECVTGLQTYANYHIFTEEEYGNTYTIPSNWIDHAHNRDYIKLIFKGTYGTVSQRIDAWKHFNN